MSLITLQKGNSIQLSSSSKEICSDPISFDRRCNNLEKCLIERGYSEREVRKQSLRARGFVKKILAELHLLLTPDVAHKAVFTNVPTIGLENDRSLKDHLVRVVLPKVDAEVRSKSCGGKKRSSEVCKLVNDTFHFKRRDTNETFNILKDPLDCNSNHVIYLLECKQCQYRFPYVGGT